MVAQAGMETSPEVSSSWFQFVPAAQTTIPSVLHTRTVVSVRRTTDWM